MISLKQFRYDTDNLAYLLFSNGNAIAIDGGAHEAIAEFLALRNLHLTHILNTHMHADHTCGNRALEQETGAKIIPIDSLLKDRRLPFEDTAISIIPTPGHSKDSICFHIDSFLFSGDTLFNGTIGNCFSGDYKAFFESVKRLMMLPDETVVLAGHDYVLPSIVFAKKLEPGNEALKHFEMCYNPNHVYSTIGQEKEINPYFRFNTKTILSLLKQRKLAVETEWERWYGLMQIE